MAPFPNTDTTVRSTKKHNGALESALWMLRIGAPILVTRQQHHRRALAHLSSRIGKPSDSSIVSPRFEFLCSRYYSSSSTSSSTSKSGFLNWYLGALETQPFITKSVSSSLIYTAADVTSQVITMPPDGSFDLKRMARISSYGLLIMGPSQHFWFNFLSRILPRIDNASVLKKILMGQSIYGPIMFSIFFSYNAALRGESKDDIVARLKRDLLPTLRNGLLYWPMCDFLTFKKVPVHLQPLVNSSFAYLWTIYLTYMASLKKVETD